MKCPTCKSTDRDTFLPVVLPNLVIEGMGRIFLPPTAATVCWDPWHEDRIVKK